MDKFIQDKKAWIDQTWQKLDKKLSKTAIKSRNKIPYTTTDGVHDNKFLEDPTWWTNGFWGGLIEIAKNVPEFERRMYIDAAMRILAVLEREFCDWSDNEDSVLQMGTEAYSRGIHMPIIYGDFFFAEAIFKLRGNDFLVW